jgi:general secretion pathway protein J
MTRTRRRGFTLVELLLALAIVSVILLLLLSAFTGAARTREALTERSRVFRQVRVAFDRIGTDLQGAFSSSIRESSALTLREDTLAGNPAATLVFTAFTLPEVGTGRPPASVVKIKYLPEDRGGRRVHRAAPGAGRPPVPREPDPLREATLAEGLKGFRVELYDGNEWHKAWPAPGKAKTALPQKAAVIMTGPYGETYRREIPMPLSGRESVLTWSGRRGGSSQ